MERNTAIRKRIMIAYATIFAISPGFAQQKEITHNIDIVYAIHKKVDKSFRFPWQMVFYDRHPLTHQFFSIAFDLGGKGEYIDITASKHMDTAIFKGSIARMKKELPKDIFSITGYRNTRIIFPVFVFIIPSDTDTLVYSKQSVKQVKEIWGFEGDGGVPRNLVTFPLLFITLTVQNQNILND